MEHSADSDIGLKTGFRGQLMHFSCILKKNAADTKKMRKRNLEEKTEEEFRTSIIFFAGIAFGVSLADLRGIYNYVRLAQKTT